VGAQALFRQQGLNVIKLATAYNQSQADGWFH